MQATQQDTSSIVRTQWAELGDQTYRLANYWTRRQCNLPRGNASGAADQLPTGGAYIPWCEDMVADCVGTAYGWYHSWVERGKPVKDGLIKAMIRRAARTVVRSYLVPESIMADVAAPADRCDDRLVDAIGRLPERLRPVALGLSLGQSRREIARAIGLSHTIVNRRVQELREHPAMSDLRAA